MHIAHYSTVRTAPHLRASALIQIQACTQCLAVALPACACLQLWTASGVLCVFQVFLWGLCWGSSLWVACLYAYKPAVPWVVCGSLSAAVLATLTRILLGFQDA